MAYQAVFVAHIIATSVKLRWPVHAPKWRSVADHLQILNTNMRLITGSGGFRWLVGALDPIAGPIAGPITGMSPDGFGGRER